MHRNNSRKAMHSAALRLATSRDLEAAFEEWQGVHPHDDFANGAREERRREVHYTNRRAGKRIAYVCEREARAHTKSTAELRYALAEADHLLAAESQRLLNGTGSARRYRAARAAVAAARTALAARLAETTRQSEAPETNLSDQSAIRPRNRAERRQSTRVEKWYENRKYKRAALLFRRLNISILPTIERLKVTLTLAPGAPSRAVCV